MAERPGQALRPRARQHWPRKCGPVTLVQALAPRSLLAHPPRGNHPVDEIHVGFVHATNLLAFHANSTRDPVPGAHLAASG
jgi:hypothetical protein